MSDGTNPPATKFLQAYHEEQAEIAKRRRKQFYIQEKDPASQQDCIGLALSGGGIRSATFCLGFLQELNRLKLLRIFDYLSTVSGGGYVGGWWSAWLSRDEKAIRRTGDPLLELRNFHNASSLVARIADGEDEITKDLREQIRLQDNQTYRLLTKYNDGEEPTDELLNKLRDQLNVYIRTFVKKSPLLALVATRPEAEQKLTTEQKVKLQSARQQEKDQQWDNRFRLEEAFPYELRNNFPPDELVEPVRRLKEDKEESEGSLHAYRDPIHHLRLFANYLTPRKGMLSADTWRAVSSIIRNLTLTWLILLPVLVTIMLLGQAYLLLNPWTTEAFMGAPHRPNLTSTMAPLALLVSWSIVIAIGWLICNREATSATDLLVQVVCLLALLGLLASGLYSINSSLISVRQFGKFHWILLGTWAAITAVFMTVIWFWGFGTRVGVDDPESLSRWRKEDRRSRFSRAQAKLLVTTTVVGVVLFVSWLCTSPRPTGFSVKLPIAILPVLSIAGSIFTALRARPTAAGDRSTLREPSFISRMVFAVTPPMVLVVLAACAGVAANRLLRLMISNPPTQDATPPLSSLFFLYVSAMLFISLCVALAVYEMKDVEWSKIVEPSVAAILFIVMGMVTASWFFQAMLYSKVHGGWDREVLYWVSMAVAVVITVFLLVRVLPRDYWKAKVLSRLEQAKDLAGPHRKPVVAAVGGLQNFLSATGLWLVGILTVVGWSVGHTIYVRTSGGQYEPGKIFPGIVLSFVGIAGGVIVYRLFLRRKESQSGFNFEFRWLRKETLSNRPEPRWVLAALCLIGPVALVCLGHTLAGKHEPAIERDKLYLLFPIVLILLIAVLILLRSLVIEKPDKTRSTSRWAKMFDWAAKVPKEYQPTALRALAVFALSSSIIAQPVSRTFSASAMSPIGDLQTADLVLMGATLLLNFPIFAAAILHLEPNPKLKVNPTFQRWSWIYSKFFLWTLAFTSIVLALTLGVLLHVWLIHISEIPLDGVLTPILLPGAVGCFLLVLIEMYWGEGENRSALWLISLAYIGFATIFFLSFTRGNTTIFYWEVVLGLLAAVVVWVVSLGWMVDPNAVSMHQFYKGRLVRAYLGASNVRRNRHGKKEITETVAGDDLLLNSIHNCDRGGPYHIINTTLNLVGGRDLATAQRSASSFTLSQNHCGSARTDYRPTKEYMSGFLSLGTAIAASGAAVSPNMGSKKPTAALAMLMTLLNVRLGYWAPTPNREVWKSSQPRLWPFYLLREFFSQTNDVATYCYLTDGGHFDNTGLYSLIERGCRYIVLVDCGADPKPACFQDLGEAIRRCRIDFGTEIELSLDSLVDKEIDRCCVFGKIYFSPEHMQALREHQQIPGRAKDCNGMTGTIIYIKPTVIPTVTADVRQYSLENSFFPQQTTANQWFDEAQFESYRRLGQFCANQVFDIDAVERFATEVRPSREALENIFNELENASRK